MAKDPDARADVLQNDEVGNINWTRSGTEQMTDISS